MYLFNACSLSFALSFSLFFSMYAYSVMILMNPVRTTDSLDFRFAKFTHNTVLLICLTKSLHDIKMLGASSCRTTGCHCRLHWVFRLCEYESHIWIFHVTWGFKAETTASASVLFQLSIMIKMGNEWRQIA